MSTPHYDASSGPRHAEPLEAEPLDVEPTELPEVPATAETAAITVHEERTEVGTDLHETGRVRVRKHVDTVPVEQVVPRSVEHADISERLPASEDDSGEVMTLPDGSVSIPVFEEVLVVTKKLVVRERVVVRKETVVDEYKLQTELRREHVSVEADDDLDIEDRRSGGAAS
jgi:uncharacterized protein (TIGR02271 family)